MERSRTVSEEEEEEDAKPLAVCEEKRKELARHRQYGKEVQDSENKPWRSEELKMLKKEMPRLKESYLAKVAKTHKAKTGVGCDGFHTKVPLDSTRETRGEVVEVLEQCGRWPPQACTTTFSRVSGQLR